MNNTGKIALGRRQWHDACQTLVLFLIRFEIMRFSTFSSNIVVSGNYFEIRVVLRKIEL